MSIYDDYVQPRVDAATADLQREIVELNSTIRLQQLELDRMRAYLTKLGFDWEREIPLEKP